jgi:hypothetical protein
MLMRIKAAVVSAAFLAGAAGIAYAQGSITQDPGGQAPRNLTLQYLGPSGAGVTIPGEPGKSGRWQPLGPQSGRGAAAAIPGYGSSAPGAANLGGHWTSPLGGNR